jgi:hypothetical protein
MPKAASRSKAKPETKKTASPTKAAGSKKKVVEVPVSFGLVDFSYQNIAYQIDLDKSKVYRRFIEVEKSKQGSIITAYRTGSSRAPL